MDTQTHKVTDSTVHPLPSYRLDGVVYIDNSNHNSLFHIYASCLAAVMWGKY